MPSTAWSERTLSYQCTRRCRPRVSRATLGAVEGVRVEFRDIAKRFGRRLVLSGVTGTATPGKVLVITGPNGSGKSTLLNILAGLVRPTRGSVRYLLDGQELSKSQWFRLLGVCAPDMAVYEELSALENLVFFSRVRGLALPQELLEHHLQVLGLRPADLRRPVGQFSSGMLQRVKLAQALVHDPQVLVLDEPSSNLDSAGHELLAQLLTERARRCAVIVATNDPREVAWGDTVLELAA